MNYKKEYNKFLTSHILDVASNKIIDTAFLTIFAIYLGFSDYIISIFTIFFTISTIFQCLSGPIFNKIGQSKKVVMTNYIIYRTTPLLYLLIPFITSDINIQITIFYILAFIYAFTGQIGYILIVNWYMNLIKKEDRLNYTTKRMLFRNIIVMSFTLLSGFILEYYKNNNQITAFIILFAVALIISLTDIMIKLNTYKPEIKSKEITFKNNFSLPFKDKKYKSILFYASLITLSLGFGTIYTNIYLLKYLNINYIYFNILLLISYIFGALFSYYLSRKMKKRNWNLILKIITLLFAIAYFSLFINESIIILPLIYILLGTANAYYDIYNAVALYEEAKIGYQTSYITFVKFITGIVAIIIPFITYYLFEHNNINIKCSFLIAATIFTLTLILLIKKYGIITKEKR